MVKGIICFVVGSWVGVMLMALLQAGRDADGFEEIAEMVQEDPEREAMGFERVRGFSRNCAPVCGNCVFWEAEVFSWGKCRICKLSYQTKAEGDVCNIRGGEVVRK